MSEQSNNTVSILTEYAFPKLSQYYSSKNKTCLLDQYHSQLIQYFTNNHLDIHNFYNSSIPKSDFISMVIKCIDDDNGTQNSDNFALQTSIKRLYTILQLHQHAIAGANTVEIRMESITVPKRQLSQSQIKKKERERMSIVHELSSAQSELFSMQQKVDTLKHIADETQKKLLETKGKESEYKQTVSQLKHELKSEKSEISQVNDRNRQLQKEMQQILSVNSELSNKMIEFEKAQILSNKIQDLEHNKQEILLQNRQLSHRMEESDSKQSEYKQMINELRAELKQTKLKKEHSESELKIVANEKDLKTGQIRKVYKQGFLVKQGKRFKSYKTRYFKLFDDGNIEYFKKITDKSRIGTFNITDMSEIRKITYPNNKNLYGFEIVTRDRTWRFQAQSHDIIKEWITIIQSVVTKLTDNDTKIILNDMSDEKVQNSPTHSPKNRNSKILSEGWMYKAGKWDTNWTHRYCVLSVESVVRNHVLVNELTKLQCFIGPNKRETHCIAFKDVKQCIALDKNGRDSAKFKALEIPTAFAFHLVTLSRVYTFACNSKSESNVWLEKIGKICGNINVSSKVNTEHLLQRRSSMVKLGSSLNKLGTSLGRLMKVTPEHVTTTQVLGNKCSVGNGNGKGTVLQRRTSVPCINGVKLQRSLNLTDSRRHSAPFLPGLSAFKSMKELQNESSQNVDNRESIDNAEDFESDNLNDDSDDYVNESDISSLDEYDST